jgi:hypothetical protein
MDAGSNNTTSLFLGPKFGPASMPTSSGAIFVRGAIGKVAGAPPFEKGATS